MGSEMCIRDRENFEHSGNGERHGKMRVGVMCMKHKQLDFGHFVLQ